ncbi:ABC transporter, permease [Bacillus sp. JCM 19046]|nr:ABC transporter, permease [Bacillus sp. JCM 19045]GAF18203.1 ABC transporter, permease [Bacillus sp. JCM 19046]
MNQHQLTAMLHRELLDVRYNGQVVTLMFLPLFALLTVLFTDNSTSWSFPLILTLYFFPMHMQGFILVEEKEQRTWRILRQQGITLFHLTLVKTLFTLFVSLLTMFGLVYAITLSLTEALLTSLFLIPVLLIMISFGTILAALFKNTIEVSLWGSPLFALLFVLELPNRFLYETAWYPYIELLPHSVFFQGIAIIRTEPAQAFLYPFLYLTITAILIIFLTNYVLRKKEATFKP